MNRITVALPLLVLSAASALLGQSSSKTAAPSSPAIKIANSQKKSEAHLKPFSRVALSGGVSAMGVNLQVATNLQRHLNLRATGNVFNYTVNNISASGSDGTDGFNLNAKVNMAAAGASLDYYPFPTHGLRLSPGVLFYNKNKISANAIQAGGDSFTLNDNTYYSATANPLNVTANLGLNTHQQAFTSTIGWGNMIPRRGGHWSFPFELGAAFTGTPDLKVNLAGSACLDQAQTECSDVSNTKNAVGADVQSDLNTQVAKWKSDLDPLKVYPIFSFGVAYAFHIR